MESSIYRSECSPPSISFGAAHAAWLAAIDEEKALISQPDLDDDGLAGLLDASVDRRIGIENQIAEIPASDLAAIKVKFDILAREILDDFAVPEDAECSFPCEAVVVALVQSIGRDLAALASKSGEAAVSP